MKQVRCTDASGVSLDDLLKRLERCEKMIGIDPNISISLTSDANLSRGGREARAMRDRVQSINRENAKFWAKESA